MPDYQKMYTALFNEITDTIARLQMVQRATEEMYVASREALPPLELVFERDDSVKETASPQEADVE